MSSDETDIGDEIAEDELNELFDPNLSGKKNLATSIRRHGTDPPQTHTGLADLHLPKLFDKLPLAVTENRVTPLAELMKLPVATTPKLGFAEIEKLPLPDVQALLLVDLAELPIADQQISLLDDLPLPPLVDWPTDSASDSGRAKNLSLPETIATTNRAADIQDLGGIAKLKATNQETELNGIIEKIGYSRVALHLKKQNIFYLKLLPRSIAKKLAPFLDEDEETETQNVDVNLEADESAELEELLIALGRLLRRRARDLVISIAVVRELSSLTNTRIPAAQQTSLKAVEEPDLLTPAAPEPLPDTSLLHAEQPTQTITSVVFAEMLADPVILELPELKNTDPSTGTATSVADPQSANQTNTATQTVFADSTLTAPVVTGDPVQSLAVDTATQTIVADRIQTAPVVTTDLAQSLAVDTPTTTTTEIVVGVKVQTEPATELMNEAPADDVASARSPTPVIPNADTSQNAFAEESLLQKKEQEEKVFAGLYALGHHIDAEARAPQPDGIIPAAISSLKGNANYAQASLTDIQVELGEYDAVGGASQNAVQEDATAKYSSSVDATGGGSQNVREDAKSGYGSSPDAVGGGTQTAGQEDKADKKSSPGEESPTEKNKADTKPTDGETGGSGRSSREDRHESSKTASSHAPGGP